MPFDPASRQIPVPRARPLRFGNRVSPGIQYGLDREAHGYVRRAVENLKDLVAGQTAEFAPGPLFGSEFNPPVAGVAFGAGDVGLLHLRNMRLRRDRSSQFRCPVGLALAPAPNCDCVALRDGSYSGIGLAPCGASIIPTRARISGPRMGAQFWLSSTIEVALNRLNYPLVGRGNHRGLRNETL